MNNRSMLSTSLDWMRPFSGTGWLIAAALITLTFVSPASAQRDGGNSEGGGDGPSRPPHSLPSPSLPAPTVQSIPTPPPPTHNTPPPNRFPFTPPVVVPSDVESNLFSFPGGAPHGVQDFHMMAVNGVILLKNNDFPEEKALQGPISGITVKWRDGSDFKKVNDYIVELDKGEILISVKRPSKMALLKTPFGQFSITSNGDVLARLDNDVLRVTNLDGLGKKIKAQFDEGVFAKKITVALAAGSELVAGKKPLGRSDMRPHDGLARRAFKVIEDKHLAVSEISIESIYRANDLIAQLRQSTTGVKERRILGDMSKMAAILNARNGTQGFTVEEGSQLAQKEGRSTQ